MSIDAERARELVAELRRYHDYAVRIEGSVHGPCHGRLHDLCLDHLPVLLDLAEAGLAAQDEHDDDEALRARMAGLLDGVALAIHGEPDPDTAHSWHDLPELTRAAQERIAALEAELAQLRGAYEYCKAGRAELFAERNDLRRKHDALTRLFCNPENEDA